MNFRRSALAALAAVLFASSAFADNVPQTLPFNQNWTTTTLITADDDWANVPGIIGFRGDGLAGSTAANPQTITAESTVVDVNANQTNPNTFVTGGVAEFHISDPVVALQGSGTARAPYLLIHLNTSGKSNVVVSYKLRDIDGSTDNAVQPVALQYRVGSSGPFVNIASAFIADASTGPSLATAVTNVVAALPAAAENQSLVQVRIITTDAVGSDEWIGIDDISITASGTATNNPPTITAPANPIKTVAQDATPFAVTLSGTDDNGIFNWSATPVSGISSVTVSGGQGTANVTYTVTLVSGSSGTASFTASLSDNVNAAVTRTVNISVTPLVANNPPVITAFANPRVTVAQDAAPFQLGFGGSDDNNVFTWSSSALNGISAATVTSGQGTANATYTVTLQPGFSGTSSFNVVLSDGVNANVTANATITVTPAPPPPLDHIVVSQVYGGGGNTGATYQNDFVELYNPTTAAVDLGGWTIQYGAATGSTWQVQPLGGIMQPGEYYLIALASGGANGSALPAANVSGNINISGTTGKIALSNNGDPFDSCPIGDATLVDLVGYGTTANCREGGTNAPAPSNTTSIFRKNGGFTDTNINGSDFATGAPNPRRTTPITEIGPSVLRVDPRANATTSPKDATITVTFTEPVTTNSGWYDITCATTGNHNDATTASTDSGKIWAITPNVNFAPAEQCTLTVVASSIHDVDTDDVAPNTDTLSANKVWSFTVAAGQAAPYGPEVHLTMGLPAAADATDENNYLMMKPTYALSYNKTKGTPNWVSWHLEPAWYGSLDRVDTFRPDPAIPPTWYRVQAFDYFASGFDRGHMTPNADRDNQFRLPINQETFLMSNMVPQAPDNNQGPWAAMENALRSIADAGNELYIISGPAGVGGTGSSGFMSTIANGAITVPASTWKVALFLPKDDHDDVGRVTASTQAIAVIMPNIQGIRSNDWSTYVTTVDAVEALTGYDFLSNVPEVVQNAIEAGKYQKLSNPPGAANQSVSTPEDAPVTFNLNAVSSTTSLTTTIVKAPTHGTLVSNGTTETYTPAPDFFGDDTFIYNVTGTNGTSNNAQVTITISAVNDAPTATADSKSTNEDAPLAFAASDLTDNDNPGPNESTQTLTVTSVSVTADTHGSVSLVSGQITYGPAPDFHGVASFTYSVCDNGFTGASLDSKCATATVTVTVSPVNDAPAASINVVSTSPEGTEVIATVTVTDPDDTSFTYAWTLNGSPYGTGTSIRFTPNDNGPYLLSVVVKDPAGASGSDSKTVSVTNVAPTVSIGGAPSSSPEGTSIAMTSTVTDPGTADTFTYVWKVTKNGVSYAAGSSSTFGFTPDDNGTYAVMLTVTDDDGGLSTATRSITVTNVAPVITSVSGTTAPVPLGSSASVRVGYTDAGTADTHTATFTWDDGSSSTVNCAASACTATHTYATAGVYTVTIVVTDDDGGFASTKYEYVVVYDAAAGAVTGGGWVVPTTGKASFGFNAKYLKGQALPTGDTQFTAPGIDFHAKSYEWLVVAGSKAQYRGTGTVNGSGNFSFLVTAVDGDVTGGDGIDRFRIKIWATSTGTVVYDNVAGAPDDIDSANPQRIGGGSIQIH